jgi:TatD DNase family protein
MSLTLYDTHAHLTDSAYAESLEQVLQAAKSAGIVAINVIGFDAATSVAACQLAEAHPGFLYAAVGIQPNSAAGAAAEDWRVIERLALHPRVKAIGETGLDRYWNDTPIVVQQDYFERHIALAAATARPLVIHMRDSGRDIVDQLRPHAKHRQIQGVMHSFSGDWELCRECLDLGLMISFAGMVTFKKSQELRDVAAKVPLDRLLVETDCPYLSPEPLRGRRPNEPARVAHTLRAIAEARGETAEVLAAQTTINAKRLFAVE